jgi:hypothetical protein
MVVINRGWASEIVAINDGYSGNDEWIGNGELR